MDQLNMLDRLEGGYFGWKYGAMDPMNKPDDTRLMCVSCGIQNLGPAATPGQLEPLDLATAPDTGLQVQGQVNPGILSF